MKSVLTKKLTALVIPTIASLFLFANPLLEAANVCKEKAQAHKPSSISDYLPSYPWLGLALNEVTYGPITVYDAHIHDGEKIVFASPGQILHGSLRYRVDSTHQNFMHRYHLVIGLKGIGAQNCVTHTYGVWDSKGKGSFSLKAPMEPGVYEVRFSYQEAETCEAARSVWKDDVEPTAHATIGIVIVK